MLKIPPSFAPLTCMSPAVPVSCIEASACIDTPVAPIGWPLALRPPDGLIGSLPSLPTIPSRRTGGPSPPGPGALPFRRESHRFVFDQLGDGETVVHLGERKIRQRYASRVKGLLPGLRGA